MAVMLDHARDTPDPPSAVSEIEIPPELETVVLALLAKAPERLSDARQLAARLAAIAGPRWAEEGAEQWWALHAPPPIEDRLDDEKAPAP